MKKEVACVKETGSFGSVFSEYTVILYKHLNIIFSFRTHHSSSVAERTETEWARKNSSQVKRILCCKPGYAADVKNLVHTVQKVFHPLPTPWSLKRES